MIYSILQNIYLRYVNRNDASRRKYMQKLGCKIGDNTRFTGSISLGSEPYLIEIGSDCLLSDCCFNTHDGGVKVLNSLGFFKEGRMDKIARIKIGNNCFIGNGARFMMGVSIGDNCIIGADSLVSKNIPTGSVAAGIPARVICTIEEYYEKNKAKGVFYPTAGMTAEEKKKYLLEHVPDLG